MMTPPKQERNHALTSRLKERGAELVETAFVLPLLLTLLIGVFWAARAYSALYAYATLRSGNSKAGFVTAGSIYALAAPSFSLRPQMLGYLSIILTLIALERFRQGKTGLMVSSTAMELPVLLVLVMGMIRIVQADNVQFGLDYRRRVTLLFHNILLRATCPRAT